MGKRYFFMPSKGAFWNRVQRREQEEADVLLEGSIRRYATIEGGGGEETIIPYTVFANGNVKIHKNRDKRGNWTEGDYRLGPPIKIQGRTIQQIRQDAERIVNEYYESFIVGDGLD